MLALTKYVVDCPLCGDHFIVISDTQDEATLRVSALPMLLGHYSDEHPGVIP